MFFVSLPMPGLYRLLLSLHRWDWAACTAACLRHHGDGSGELNDAHRLHAIHSQSLLVKGHFSWTLTWASEWKLQPPSLHLGVPLHQPLHLLVRGHLHRNPPYLPRGELDPQLPNQISGRLTFCFLIRGIPPSPKGLTRRCPLSSLRPIVHCS